MQNKVKRFPAILAIVVLIALPLRADDGAASIAAGGLVLMKREPRIVMAKEVLSISENKVIVDYDFRNDSADNITTEIAFPIPAYVAETDGPLSSQAGFDDFKLTINGAPATFQTEVRAFTKKVEITKLLKDMKVDAASFGHLDDQQTKTTDVFRLNDAQRKQLVALGALDSRDQMMPTWRVEKKYHWTQTFPAHGTVHIRHEYTPVLGASNMVSEPEYSSLCPSPALRKSIAKDGNSESNMTGLNYVDFILTTANTWKTPIEDFTLIVDRPIGIKDMGILEPSYVSFCWDGPITKDGPNRFIAHTTNLIPAKELHIGFFTQQQRR
jgi:Domain of unknown function (DUF4424)